MTAMMITKTGLGLLARIVRESPITFDVYVQTYSSE